MSAEEIQTAQRRQREKTAEKQTVQSEKSNQNAVTEIAVMEMVGGNTVSFTSYQGQPSANHDSWLSKLIKRIYSLSL